jgi:hypothetical protein
MKRFVLFASVVAVLLTVGSVSAAVTLDFGTGSATSPAGDCTMTGTTAICTNVGVGILKVSADLYRTVAAVGSNANARPQRVGRSPR